MADTPIERLQRRIPGANDTLLQDMLDDATGAVLNATGRAALPDPLPAGLASVLVRLAAALYNQLGMEGQSSHSEGGVSVSVGDLLASYAAELAPYTYAKVGL